jgi:hypothetical protein
MLDIQARVFDPSLREVSRGGSENLENGHDGMGG